MLKDQFNRLDATKMVGENLAAVIILTTLINPSDFVLRPDSYPRKTFPALLWPYLSVCGPPLSILISSELMTTFGKLISATKEPVNVTLTEIW